jgi:polyisoprenyl-phosphate glycosyltransferase
VDILKRFDESPLFYRGLIKWIGFRQYGISYTVKERSRGQTKYTLSKMVRFALSGITGFSVKPLQVSFRLGLSIAFLAFIYGLYALYAKMFTGKVIEGWTSLIIVISLMGGIQLITIGILGEYIGKLFTEQKKRPHYIIKQHSSDVHLNIKSSGS